MSLTRTLSSDSLALRVAGWGLVVGLVTVAVGYVLSGKEMPLLLAALAGLFCLLIFRNPHWGVLAIFTFWFLRYSPTLLGSRFLQLSHIIALLLFVPLALRLLRDREVWVFRVPQVKYILAIAVLFLVGTMWADYKYPITFFPELDTTVPNAQDFVTHLVFLVFFLYFVNTRRKLDAFVWLVIGLIVLSVADASSRLILMPGVRRVNASFGLGKSPTVFPYVCLFGASLLWCYYALAPTWRWKGWVLPVLAVIPVIALATGSRTAFLQLMVFVTLAFLDRSGNWSSSKRIRGIVLLACVGMLMMLVVPSIAVMRSTSFQSTGTGPGVHSLRDRVETVKAGAAMVISDPVLGVGLGNFLWLHTARNGLKRFAHNSYLWAAAEGGLPVLALYLLFFYATYRMLRQMEVHGPPDIRWLAKALRMNLILLMVYSMSDEAWIHDLTFLLVAASIVLYRLWVSQLSAGPAPPPPTAPATTATPRPAGAFR